MVVQNVIFLGFGETNQGWFYQVFLLSYQLVQLDHKRLKRVAQRDGSQKVPREVFQVLKLLDCG
jgi:hypothetical protein